MRPQALTTTVKPPPQLSSMPYLRGVFQYAKAFYFMVVLACTLFILATCEPCSINGLRNQLEHVACGSFEENSDTDYRKGFAGSVTSAHASENAVSKQNLDNVCPQSNLFCFRSTLPGFNSSILKVPGFQSDVALFVGSNQVRMNGSSSPDSGSFKLSGGRTVSCSLSYQDISHGLPCHLDDISSCSGPLPDLKTQDFKSKERTGTVKSAFLDSSSPHVEIRPALLDWGQQYLYFPSSAFLTVKNTHVDHILNVYEPYISSSQFYPCNFSEFTLAPGEVASICFMFLPTWIGLSSAQLVLQTSGGGFLIHAKGTAVESPYGIQPLVGLDISTNGKWSNNLSLSNPFNEAISVEELTAWISVSSGNTSSLTRTICNINSTEDPSEFRLTSVKEWLNVRSSELDLPMIAMRPHRNWEVAPGKTQTIMELDFSYHSEGKVSGAFCMQLLSSSKKKVDTVMVPLEVEWSASSASDELISPVTVSVEVLMPCDTSRSVAAVLSVRNDAPYMLSVVEVSIVGGNANLNIKYTEGLILFPSTNTQVGVVTYSTVAIQKADPLHETPEIIKNCKLFIRTNDSRCSPTEILCEDLISICSRQNLYSSIGYQRQSEGLNNDNTETGYMDSGTGPPSLIKALDTAEADELVLRNWKSQATASNMSILDDHEIVFPTVQVGTHLSRWITVKNPSQKPVVMQLILNSAEIVDECRAMDRLLLPSSSSSLVNNNSVAPTRYGFSIAESAVTEAFVHPYSRALLGPIFFQPSDRCGWKSSALIRNNLSGVEWLSLQGFGGSLSLVLLEESEPVQSLDFKLNLPAPLNFSSPDPYCMVDKTYTCSQPSLKDLHAMNTGDLPLEVRRIEVSGTECGLDGFLVHTCKGFALEPGQFVKLTISYQTDFSAATLHRDLELALTSGILVIPMKASVSMHMFNICKRSIFWMQVKKSIIAVFLAASILFVLVCCILPHLMAFRSQGYLFKNGQDSTATISHVGISSHVHRVPEKGNKFSITSQINEPLKSIGEERVLLLESMGGYPDCQVVSQERDLTFSLVNPMPGYHKQTNFFLDIQKEKISPSSAATKSVALDRSNTQEALQVENLTIKTGNGKRRRHRKKRSSGAGLAAAFEVSSSHSGNSTPSSPLSPATSLTPTRPWQLSPNADQSCQSRNLFAQVADLRRERRTEPRPVSKVNVLEPEMSVKYVSENCSPPTQEKPTVPRKIPGKPFLFPSATFPSAGRAASDLMSDTPLLVSTSKIAAHARAPGSKFHDQKAVKTEENTGLEEKFTYDIWGNHIFGQPPTGQSTGVSKKQPHAIENNSSSFFVRGPQTLIANSQLKSALECVLSGIQPFEPVNPQHLPILIRCKMLFRSHQNCLESSSF